MAHINLLPWRETQRKERQREFISIAVLSAMLMVGILFLAHIQVRTLVGVQEARNSYLDDQIKEVDTRMKEIQELETQKQQLLARMNIIQELQTSRPGIVRMVQELVAVLPEGVSYTKLARSGSSLTIEGVAQSNSRISSLMRNLDASPLFANPRLIVIDTSKNPDKQNAQAGNWFNLQVDQEGVVKKTDETKQEAKR